MEDSHCNRENCNVNLEMNMVHGGGNHRGGEHEDLVNPIEADHLALGVGRQADYNNRNRVMALHSTNKHNNETSHQRQ